jgi:hypothetical protein
LCRQLSPIHLEKLSSTTLFLVTMNTTEKCEDQLAAELHTMKGQIEDSYATKNEEKAEGVFKEHQGQVKDEESDWIRRPLFKRNGVRYLSLMPLIHPSNLCYRNWSH